jgi:hypothetical protein
MDRLAGEDLYPGDEGYLERKIELTREYERYKARTSVGKNLEGANEAEDLLLEMPFFKQESDKKITRDDLSRGETMKIERQVRALETQGDAKLDSKVVTSLMQIRSLAHLGDRASNLTDAQTGIIDNFFFNVRKYFFDDPEGIDAASAYSEFSNMARHAIFGSVLPAAEIKSHMESFGSLKYQRGAVLAHLRSNVEKVRNDYEMLLTMSNPLVFEWRAGKTGEELNATIAKLDRQLYEIDIVARDLPIPVTTTPLQKNKYGVKGQLFESQEEQDRLDRELGFGVNNED